MPWRSFVAWNAAGGICWAASIGGGAYLLGAAARGAFGLLGLAVGAAVVLLLLVRIVRARRVRR